MTDLADSACLCTHVGDINLNEHCEESAYVWHGRNEEYERKTGWDSLVPPGISDDGGPADGGEGHAAFGWGARWDSFTDEAMLRMDGVGGAMGDVMLGGGGGWGGGGGGGRGVSDGGLTPRDAGGDCSNTEAALATIAPTLGAIQQGAYI